MPHAASLIHETELSRDSGSANAQSEGLAADGPIDFGFRYLDKPFAATVTPGDGQARLALRGQLGVVPFTAESAPVRAAVLALLRTKDGSGLGRFELAENHDVLLHGECEIGLPLSAAEIIAGAAEILLSARDQIAAVLSELREVPEASEHSEYAAGSISSES